MGKGGRGRGKSLWLLASWRHALWRAQPLPLHPPPLPPPPLLPPHRAPTLDARAEGRVGRRTRRAARGLGGVRQHVRLVARRREGRRHRRRWWAPPRAHTPSRQLASPRCLPRRGGGRGRRWAGTSGAAVERRPSPPLRTARSCATPRSRESETLQAAADQRTRRAPSGAVCADGRRERSRPRRGRPRRTPRHAE